tara:strand:+ start:155 stop:655 length:501 start_codon:yes stop_codon:yes gene_type:complete
MKYQTFINKLKKRLGTKDLDISADSWGINGRKEWLVHEDTVASWRVELSDYRDENSPLVVSSLHTKAAGQESDPHTDYFPGTFWRNATQLIDRLQSPPAKYPAGVLVRGKQNKRAIRQGYAGKVGLVVKNSGKYMQVQFNNSDWLNNTVGWTGATYPERDFELVSG